MRTSVKAAIEAAIIKAWGPGLIVTSLSVKEYEGWAWGEFSIEEDESDGRVRIQNWEAKFFPVEGGFRLAEPELQDESFSWDDCHVCGGPSRLGIACQNCC
jgi:hypothetical protein